MKIRLSGDQVRRLNALVDAHPQLGGIEAAHRYCIEVVTHELIRDDAEAQERWNAERAAAWAERKAKATKRPSRRVGPQRRQPEIVAPSRAPRPDPVRELVLYKHGERARTKPAAPTTPTPTSSSSSSSKSSKKSARSGAEGGASE